MIHNRRFPGLLMISGPLLAAAACESLPLAGAGYGSAPPRSAVPAVPAYVMDEAIGGEAARARKARTAGIRPLTPVEVANYFDRQELELRRQTAGTGVDVIRSGHIILIRLPALLTFNVGSSDVSPQAASMVSEIGLTLRTYNRSLVDVLGHTDSTGNPASNQILSQRRAETVAARLRARGVSPARIATRGYASSQPISDNATEHGRSLNRRVEIKVVPLR